MSNRAQITRQAARDGVPAPTVERDYVLAHIVAGLGSLGDDHGLVFKGATALRLCYFGDYRYSADLDFSVVDGNLAAAYGTIEAALAVVTGAVRALTLTNEEPRRIRYQGPLGRERSLKLDIVVDELVLNVDTIGLLPRWPDLPETHDPCVCRILPTPSRRRTMQVGPHDSRLGYSFAPALMWHRNRN